jgi:hypothetical protein
VLPAWLNEQSGEAQVSAGEAGVSVIPIGMTAFGLICSGSYSHAMIDPKAHLGLSGHVLRHETHELQIDLHAGRWCADLCQEIEQVDATTAEWISLSAVDTPRYVRVVSINRTTGDFYSSVREEGSDDQARAVCRLSPFRGLTPQEN